MKLRPKLCIGISLAPTWLSGEGWRLPGSGIEGLYSSDFALETAKAAEAAHLDFVFRPDASFLPLPVMEQSFGFSSLDATLLMTAIARETAKIGLVTTISTTFGHPYIAARQLMSLHWLSQGRAGWNVVTALQGHENFGLPDMPSSDARYARAAEFTEVVRRLWASFPSDALVVDRAAGRYADTDLILPINHRGPDFQVQGPLNLPAFPGPGIPLMQAGGSATGVDFAGQVADMVFGMTPDLDTALKTRAQLSARAIAHRRAPRDLRLLPGLSLYLGKTRAEAQDLFAANHRRITRAQRIQRVTEATGLDLSTWPDDRPITLADLPKAPGGPRSAGHIALLRRIIETDQPTVEQLLARPEILASVHWQIIGTPEDAATEIIRWHEAGAIDGFIAVPGGAPQSLHLTLNDLVPRLRDAGHFRHAYQGDTLVSHLTEA
ncbi:NtaA/DmoA family FMN-dependent monooxygenase [Xinfangfangia sp. D13-10-4-6]|uniref:NtaA/DmoA family FMN-dependent monooxygenase n=1 Tax=Pseudogemmobacter hezensis TaxID=2737662 RepID=UPI001552222A|nr:NtaA/DmoA family FMN-dependent monooxygenase [Pseudogemmobacter hezensis]NPD14015.1 NtaA/DmoA family FMN-dependent monooxygenase [Pseudogemmobacter hezensis]